MKKMILFVLFLMIYSIALVKFLEILTWSGNVFP
jgi:hypothetical protein